MSQWWQKAPAWVSAVGSAGVFLQLLAHNKQARGTFLVQVDSAYMDIHAKTQLQVEQHVKRLSKDATMSAQVTELDFASKSAEDLKRVENLVPGLEGDSNFGKRREILDYAAFIELLFRLNHKGLMDIDDIRHMYKYRIKTLAAHPYVFHTMLKTNGYKGLRYFALLFLTEDEQANLSPEDSLARKNICAVCSKYVIDGGSLCGKSD